MSKYINDHCLDDHGEVMAYAWPGGYRILYACEDGGVLCPKCVQDNLSQILEADSSDPQWHVVDAFIHWEGEPITCDNCGEMLESEYGEVE